MRALKAKSSKWINENNICRHRFEWQPGYGAFSYNVSEVPVVYRYIQDQEKHHQKFSFKEEYVKLLKDFKVEFKEEYLFENLI